MTRHLKTPLTLLAALALTSGLALAEDAPVKKDAGAQSPWTFVASGEKAARDAAAEADDPAGAKVIGGKVAQDGA